MKPDILENERRFDSFKNNEILYNKKKNHLPAMGWNSWNAFGSGNTEELTKAMADKMLELGLHNLGYEYLVLDDGCYKPERIDGKLANEEVKFPSGFKALANYIHARGLKFGMYNDIGTNLCAGAAVGTCGHEKDDAASYLEWCVDFLKVDNCYYPYDNATFSNPENARFTFAPYIKAIKLDSKVLELKDGSLSGTIASIKDGHTAFLGTYDGTGPFTSPVGSQSSELSFVVNEEKSTTRKLSVLYATGKEEGCGEWLQIAVGDTNDRTVIFDDLLKETPSKEEYVWSDEFDVTLAEGENTLFLMNHRRQENTLNSYTRLWKELNEQAPDNDIIYSACEWGKTQPQNWAYKVCDSWRILNDICFRVGSDGHPGFGSWKDDYTPSITSQYNKAVIMDNFSGLEKGWNDPDMLVIGMDNLTPAMNRTHMAMWCMMNSPLMLGMDLRLVNKGDEIYNIIANSDLIDLNQDSLGIQATRVFSTLAKEAPDNEYIRDIDRIDILAKPLSDGSIALSFINVSENDKDMPVSVDISTILSFIGSRFPGVSAFKSADKYIVKDLWNKEESINSTGIFEVSRLSACDNVTIKVTPVY